VKQTISIAIFVCVSIVSPARADADIDRLADLIEGKFDTHLLDQDSPAEQRLVDKRIRLDLPNLGSHVFYQQINQGEDLQVYRQRLLVLTDSSGRLEQRAYALREPEWYVDADARTFDTITLEDLDEFMPFGCEQTWTKTSDGFRGYVDPARCQIISSRTGKARRIEAESLVSQDKLLLAERGYDAESLEKLFGSSQGEYQALGRSQ
jgi:hypothetical protein